jgi:hypothetical protein
MTLDGVAVHPDEHRFKPNVNYHLPKDAWWSASKHPYDQGRLPGLFDERPGLRAIVMIRDGRDVCSSVHPEKPGRYLVTPYRWTGHANHLRTSGLMKDPRVMVVKYEDLTRNYHRVMRSIAQFIGTRVGATWDDVARTLDPDKKTVKAMHSIRPIDTHSVARWRRPEHRERMKELFVYPEFTDELLMFGYETDKDWLTSLEPVVG